MPIARTHPPRYIKLMFETLHATTGFGTTCCGVEIGPVILVAGPLSEAFWDAEADRPQPGVCPRCAAAVRQFLGLFAQEMDMRAELKRRGEWPPPW